MRQPVWAVGMGGISIALAVTGLQGKLYILAITVRVGVSLCHRWGGNRYEPYVNLWLANMWQVMWHESIRFSFLLKLCWLMQWSMLHLTVSKCSVWHQYIPPVNQDSGLNSSTGLFDLPGEPSWGVKASYVTRETQQWLVCCVPLLSRHS